jgi:peptidoglycan hydrolase-like protein with peptidoglycan-binding domain
MGQGGDHLGKMGTQLVGAQWARGKVSLVRAKFVPLLAAAMATVFGLAACGSGGQNTASGMLPTAPSVAASAAPVVDPGRAVTPSASPSATVPPTSTPKPTASPTPTHVGFQSGDRGAAVLALQKRLSSLGFWISGADGSYGQTTEQAVMAFQKAAGLERDGVAGPLTTKAIAQGVTITPRSTSGHVLEIDKAKQLLLIVNNGKVANIINTSTGSNQPYTSGGVTSIATTPSGTFSIFRQVNADDPGPLGDLWRPKYFNGGIAIHGSPSIPGYPASHGCARMSNAAIDWIWSSGQAPIGTQVVVY